MIKRIKKAITKFSRSELFDLCGLEKERGVGGVLTLTKKGVGLSHEY